MEYSIKNAVTWMQEQENDQTIHLPSIFQFEDDCLILKEMLQAAQTKRIIVHFDNENTDYGYVFSSGSAQNINMEMLAWQGFFHVAKTHLTDYIRYLQSK